MKRSQKILPVLAALLGVAGSLWIYRSDVANSRRIASTEDKTILSDFNGFQLTNVENLSVAQNLFESLRDDLGFNPMNTCYNRAHVWAHQLAQHGVQSGKVFLFYTKQTWRNGWWFHVAPYVVIDGEEYVMENYFDFKGPTKMSDWIAAQTGEQGCAELNPRADSNLYKILKKKKPHVFPVTGAGRNCYIRKTPSSYLSTYSVYLHDKKGYRYDTLDKIDVKGACIGSMGERFESLAKRQQMCAEFMADPIGAASAKSAERLPLVGNAVEPGATTSNDDGENDDTPFVPNQN